MEKNKRNVAIKLTKKNVSKVFGLLKMFGERCPYKPEQQWGIQDSSLNAFHFTGDYWCIGGSGGKKKIVKFKEFRNILAKEHLKAGDVCVFKQGGEEHLGVISRLETAPYPYVCVDRNLTIYYDNFIRFATEEDKALLEPKPVSKEPELKVDSWYSCEIYGFDLPVILCFNGTYGSSTQYGWDACGDWSDRIGSYKEDVNNHIELSEIQVEMHLIKEAKRRGLVEGVKVQELTLSGKYYFNTVGLWSTTVEGGDIVLFNNGRWAEPIKPKEVQKEVYVVVCEDRVEATTEENAAYNLRINLGGTVIKGTLTYKI